MSASALRRACLVHRDERNRQRMKLPKHVWIGIGVAAVVTVIVGTLMIMNFSSPRRRTVVVQPKPPSVDEATARKEVDRRIADIRAKGEPILVADFKPKPLAPDVNAAEPLIAAMKWLDTKERNDNKVWELEISPRMTEAQWQQVEASLKTFAPALALVDQADGRTAVEWKIDFKSPAISILLPSLNGARHTANLLRMSALSAHRSGRHDEAVRRITQMVTLG